MSNSESIDILLVEDNQADVELTLRALRKANLANPIHVVADGAEALDYLFGTAGEKAKGDAHHPRVVILDLKLPKVSGLDVLRRMKADPTTRTIPVVVLSSSREAPDIKEAYTLGANSYIVKPVDFEKFVEAVGQLGMYWLLLNQRPH
ncbi:MAG: response regulator [Thermoanaerobaculales bacterium]